MSEKQCAICGYIRPLDKNKSESATHHRKPSKKSSSDRGCPVCHAPEDLFFVKSTK
jgi:rubredoxin